MDHPPHAGQWHEKMKQHWQAHQKALHDKLSLSKEQEAAWQTFVQSHQPPAGEHRDHPKWDELAALTTPERLQKMNEWHQAHVQQMQAHMKQHQEAVLAFYNQLTPAQQKIFDAQTLPRRGEGHRGKEQK
jgi:Fe2+ transport system protein B